MSTEQPLVFDCKGTRLLGVLHEGREQSEVGMVIVVGGPQYRVGSHRQFVLMARAFASAGITVLRFDYRGMGDAEGEQRGFKHVDDDIRRAVDCLLAERPQLTRLVLLGLCDAASAILMYVSSDPRVDKLALLNPWVHTETGEAKAYLKNYYLQRLLQRSFWKKLLSGQFNFGRSLREATDSVRTASGTSQTTDSDVSSPDFIAQMRMGVETFNGSILTLISGRDLTAAQFIERLKSDRQWARATKRSAMEFIHLPTADHTLSDKQQLEAAVAGIQQWLLSASE